MKLCWGRKRYLLPVERQRPMFEERPVQFPTWEKWSCTKTDTESRSTLLSHQWYEVEARREKEASEARVILVSFLGNRADTIRKVLARDRFVSIGTLPNVNFFKMYRDAKQETSVCSRTTRLKNNQVKNRERVFNPQNGGKRRQRCCSSTLRQASIREKKGPSRGKISRKSSSAKSLRYEIWGQISRRDWKTTAMRPKQSMEPCQHSAHPRKKWVLPAASTKEPEEREFAVGSRAKYAYGQQERLWHCWVGPWGHRDILRRWWRSMARCKPVKKRRYMSSNWHFSWRVCFFKKHPQSFHSGSSARIMGILTTGPAVRNHISPKMANGSIAILRTTYPSLSQACRRVPPETERDRERRQSKRDRERETRQDKRRRYKTRRQEKMKEERREKKRREKKR